MFRFLALVVLCLAVQAAAEPQRYVLDIARSEVRFTYLFEGKPRTGTMPVRSADLLIDLDNIPASRVSVTLNARAARAGFIFATDAMKSPSVLDVERFPDIHFRSIRFRGDLRGGTVTGDLTVRGQTRPVTLKAELFRQRGTALTDRDNLLVLLSGAISRADFGAVGYPRLVGDRIGLRIVARITK